MLVSNMKLHIPTAVCNVNKKSHDITNRGVQIQMTYSNFNTLPSSELQDYYATCQMYEEHHLILGRHRYECYCCPCRL